MSYRLVATGTASNLGEIEKYQPQFPENSEGYLQLELVSPVASDIIIWLNDKLSAVGVPQRQVKTNGRFVEIHFKTEIAPLVLIAGAVAACLFILALVVAWKLFQLSPAAAVGLSTGVILLIVGGVLLVIVLIVRSGVRVGPSTVAVGGG